MDSSWSKFNDVGSCIHEDADDMEGNPYGTGEEDCEGYESD